MIISAQSANYHAMFRRIFHLASPPLRPMKDEGSQASEGEKEEEEEREGTQRVRGYVRQELVGGMEVRLGWGWGGGGCRSRRR